MENIDDPAHLLKMLFTRPLYEVPLEVDPIDFIGLADDDAPIENKPNYWKLVLVISLLIAMIGCIAYYVLSYLE